MDRADLLALVAGDPPLATLRDDVEGRLDDDPGHDLAFSVDHFYAKLLRLPDTMLTEVGRAEARRRAIFLEQTLAQLATELGEPLP